MSDETVVNGRSPAALFTLTLCRGDGMALLAMNWKNGTPPDNFVGFGIEYKEPRGATFFPLKNRLSFPGTRSNDRLSTLLSPIQKFRWVHFPYDANLPGEFTYRVTPVFMDRQDQLSYGEAQVVSVALRRETYPGQLNVAFTRGFISSQAFVDRYESAGPISKLLPAEAADGLKFVPTHPKAKEALAWMGFEAREAIMDVLERAVSDTTAKVRVVAYDLSQSDVVSRLQALGDRLKIIIDDSADHGKPGSAENQAATLLSGSAGKENVRRQHMGNLQHNKMIVVDGQELHTAVCGSTNFSWRGFFVQSNNALILQGPGAIKPFLTAFDNYWSNSGAAGFAGTASPQWADLHLAGIDARVSFSPHAASNALLQSVADDIEHGTTSSLFYSLAFLYQTPGVIRNAIAKVTNNPKLFVYGISDREVGGIVLQKPNGNLAPIYPAELSRNVPQPFKAEPAGGGGIRMHHKFLVIDFDKPTARVYMGSYNFSEPGDTQNGENLLLIRDRKVAVSYLVEALSLFDHYHFRVTQKEAKKARKKLELQKPPRKPGEKPWWNEDYDDVRKIRDRELFA